MSVFEEFRARIAGIVGALGTEGRLPADLDTANISVEPPRDAAHGDLATNAALVLAKAARMKPRDIAEALAEKLRADGDVETVEVAGPGFVNLRLSPAYWQGVVRGVLAVGTAYGDLTAGAGRRVNIEYVSANPTGPMHVGHARGAVVGDVLASLLIKAGYTVCREYYINDAGSQIDVLARSVHIRYREALGETVGEIPAGLYPGDYLVPLGQTLAAEFGDRWATAPDNEWLPVFKARAVEAMMALIRDDLAALGVRHDVFSSEKVLHENGAIDAALAALVEAGHIYEGVLEPPKGKLPDDWEPRPQTLFRATDFGDDVDRALKKSDGAYTYFAADIAYHFDKYRRGWPEQIDVLGADHGGYVKRMKAAVKAISGGAAELDVKLCQLVNLMANGEPVKMSKRAGTFVTLREVVDEVGRDVVRFIMLTRKNDATLDFDLAKVTEQSRDNPVWYVQYAHARARSVQRNAKEQMGIEAPTADAAPLHRLTHDAELGLIRRLAEWPRVVQGAADAHEPHRIAFYLQDLAAELHGLWTKGREDESLRIIVADDPEIVAARLALIEAARLVIASGLGVMGVQPVEELH